MQSRNEIVHTVLQFKSRTISFLFLRVGFYIYCSIILGLRATPHHGTESQYVTILTIEASFDQQGKVRSDRLT